MPLLQILTDPQNFRFYAGGRGHVSNAGSFGQKSIPYGDDTKFNGFDEEIPRRNGGQKQINSIEEVTEQETLNTFESERQDIENFLNEMPTRQIAMTYSSNRRR